MAPRDANKDHSQNTCKTEGPQGPWPPNGPNGPRQEGPQGPPPYKGGPNGPSPVLDFAAVRKALAATRQGPHMALENYRAKPNSETFKYVVCSVLHYYGGDLGRWEEYVSLVEEVVRGMH